MCLHGSDTFCVWVEFWRLILFHPSLQDLGHIIFRENIKFIFNYKKNVT